MSWSTLKPENGTADFKADSLFAGIRSCPDGSAHRAAELMAGTHIRAALVLTNSVAQGETAANLWKPLFASDVHFDFAHRTFR